MKPNQLNAKCQMQTNKRQSSSTMNHGGLKFGHEWHPEETTQTFSLLAFFVVGGGAGHLSKARLQKKKVLRERSDRCRVLSELASSGLPSCRLISPSHRREAQVHRAHSSCHVPETNSDPFPRGQDSI